MQVDPVDLPAPPWLQRTPWSVKAVLACVAFGGFGVFMFVLAVCAAAESRWFDAVFYVLTAVIFLAPVYIWVIRGVDRDDPTFNQFEAEHGGGEFRIERDGAATARYLAVLGVVIVDATIFIAGVWTGALHVDLSDRRGGSLPIGAGVFGLLAFWAFAGVAIRGTSGWLRLSPVGIDNLEFGIYRHRAQWDELSEITMIPQSGKGAPKTPTASRAWLVRRATDKGAISISLSWPMGNRATYWLIDFYLKHPELRDELGDDRVVERIQSGGIHGG